MPSIIDLDAEFAKLTMFRGQTPQTTREERKGSVARLAAYRDGSCFLASPPGPAIGRPIPRTSWFTFSTERLPSTSSSEDGPHSFALGAGMIAVIPQGAWHRFRSVDGKTTMSAVVPGEHIDLDVDDPRPVLPTPAVNQDKPPSLIDLNAELAKLTMFQRTPNRRSRIERAALRDWLPTGTASCWRSRPPGKIIGNAI